MALAPADPPPTSILWGWWEDSDQVARLRIDGDTCFAAVTQMPADTTVTVPWPAADGRVGHYDDTKPDAPAVNLQFETGVVASADPSTGYAELTFIRPARRLE